MLGSERQVKPLSFSKVEEQTPAAPRLNDTDASAETGNTVKQQQHNLHSHGSYAIRSQH